jgi:hypothetical protein
VTVVLVLLALGVAVAPDDVPGLTDPGSTMEMEMGAGMPG